MSRVQLNGYSAFEYITMRFPRHLYVVFNYILSIVYFLWIGRQLGGSAFQRKERDR